MRWTAWTTVVALVALAAASAWWLSTVLRTPTGLAVDRGPAWYFQDARVAATGRGGDVLYRIDARAITHDPADDSALLDAPRLEWLQGMGPPLLIAAREGRIHQNRRQVALTGGVRVIDESTGTRLEFRSPDLLVDADTLIAHTAAEVEIDGPNGVMTGSGLVADMNAGTIRIESTVRGRYVR